MSAWLYHGLDWLEERLERFPWLVHLVEADNRLLRWLSPWPVFVLWAVVIIALLIGRRLLGGP